jgi:hypothetical protein
MARLPLSTRTRKRNLTLRNMASAIMLMYYYILALVVLSHKWKCWKIERRIKIKELRSQRMYHLICESDVKCINDLRMDRRTFHILCEMLRDVGGLRGTRNTPLEEIVAAFLHTLAHHVKNRTIGGFFLRSGETVSRNFHACLLAVLKLHQLLLKKPEPIPEGCTDFRWKHFKVPNLSIEIYLIDYTNRWTILILFVICIIIELLGCIGWHTCKGDCPN